MLDTFNTERFSVLHSQYVKITARNQGNVPNLIQEVGSGYQVGTNVISRATITAIDCSYISSYTWYFSAKSRMG